jgi:hypothetical protein
MLSRDHWRKKKDISALSDDMIRLEDHHIDANVIRRTKINKVLKAILKL